MPRVIDIICENEHVEEDVLLGMNDSIPPCECGAPRKVWWGNGKAPGVSVFRPVHVDGYGTISNQDDFHAYRKAAARNMGVSEDKLVAHQETKSERLTKADDRRHRAWERRQKKGLDRQRVEEIRSAVRKTGINPYNGRKAKAPPTES